MASLSQSVINGSLTVRGQITLNSSSTAVCTVLAGNNIPTTLSLASSLYSAVNVNNSITFIGGVATSSSGLNLSATSLNIWSPEEVNGYSGSTGSERFRVLSNGRYLCLGTNYAHDCLMTSDTSVVSYEMSVEPANSHDKKEYHKANYGQKLTAQFLDDAGKVKSNYAVTQEVNVVLSDYAVAPLGNGLVMFSGSWAVDKRTSLADDTYFRITLPCEMIIYSALVGELDYTARDTGNNWFVDALTIGKSYRVLYVCKTTLNKGTNGFSFMAIGKPADQTNLPKIFN